MDTPDTEPKKGMSARKKAGIVFLVILVGIFVFIAAAVINYVITCDESCREDNRINREHMEQREKAIARAEYLKGERVKEMGRDKEKKEAQCNQLVNEYLNIVETGLLTSSSKAEFERYLIQVFSGSGASYMEASVNLKRHCETLSMRQEIRMSLYADQIAALP